MIIGPPARRGKPGPDARKVLHEPVTADLALLKRDKTRIGQENICQPVLQLWRKAVVFAKPCLTHKAAQGGWYELIPPNGVLLSGCAVNPAIDFADGHLCRALRRQALGPVLHGVVPFRAGLGPSNEAFEVSRRADTTERLKGPAAAADGSRAGLHLGLDLGTQFDLPLSGGLHNVERNIALHG